MRPDINTYKTNKSDYQISYLDFNEYSTDVQSNTTTLNFNVHQKSGQLTKKLNYDTLDEEIISKIIELSYRNLSYKLEVNLKPDLNVSYHDDDLTKVEVEENDKKLNARRIITKILLASNNIAVKSRRGPGNRILMCSNILNNRKLINVCTYDDKGDLRLANMIVTVNDLVPSNLILVYRKNETEEPGLNFIHNKKQFVLVETGFHPENQFIRILLK